MASVYSRDGFNINDITPRHDRKIFVDELPLREVVITCIFYLIIETLYRGLSLNCSELKKINASFRIVAYIPTLKVTRLA